MRIPILTYTRQFEITTQLSELEVSEYLFKQIDKDLNDAYIKNKHRNNNTYKYKATPFRFAWNGWNRFNGVSGGEITIKQENQTITIKNRLKFTEVFIICLLFMIIPILGIFDDVNHRIIAIIIIWAVYFLNLMISNHRINDYLEETVHDIFEKYDLRKGR